VLWLCVAGVDYQPYFSAPYFKLTTDRLQTNQLRLAQGDFAAGFGRAVLTPTLNSAEDDPVHGRFRMLPLAGFGNRKGRPATGVHDDVYVKAMALSAGGTTGVLVSVDALIVPREVTELAMARLDRELHLAREQVYLSASHTHASLGGWGEGMVAEAFAGGFQPGIRIWWADRIVSAVTAALADVRPASFGHGSVAAPQHVRNRLVGRLGRVNGEFGYMVVRQEGGKLGVIGSYGAHATVLSASNMEFSGDYPGYWQRAIESTTGGVAMFVAGGVGSHAPVAGDSGFKGAERMGTNLAQLVLEQVARTPLTNRVTFALCGLVVDLPPLSPRLTDGVRLRPWLARRLLPVRPDTFMQALRLDDMIWISSPCDFSGELALPIKDAYRPRGFEVAVTSFNGDYIGYVVSSRYYHLGGYEPRLMSFFGPCVPDYFDDLARQLAEAVIQPMNSARQSRNRSR
jgi:neutral ceramidase